MLQRIKNKKIKTKNLFIVPVGYNKIYGTGKEIQDYSLLTGEPYHREVRTYKFAPINPIYNICVKKDDERDLWVDIITGNEYQMFDINLEDSTICVSNRIIPVSKYFLEEKVSFEDLKELILKLNETENKKMIMKEYVENFEEFVKTNPEEAKQIALEALIATGVLDENGNAKEQIVTSSQYIGKEEKAPTKTLTKPKKNNK